MFSRQSPTPPREGLQRVELPISEEERKRYGMSHSCAYVWRDEEDRPAGPAGMAGTPKIEKGWLDKMLATQERRA